jgi:hypothetical protein
MTCRHSACEASTTKGRLYCRDHWRAISKRTRSAIRRSAPANGAEPEDLHQWALEQADRDLDDVTFMKAVRSILRPPLPRPRPSGSTTRLGLLMAALASIGR